MVRYKIRRLNSIRDRNKNLKEIISFVITFLIFLIINRFPIPDEEGLFILLMKQLFIITDFWPILLGAIVMTAFVEIWGFVKILTEVKRLINKC